MSVTKEKLERAERISRALGLLFTEMRETVFALSPDGTFVAANQAAQAQYGYALEELLEMRIHDLMAAPVPTLGEDLALAFRDHETVFSPRAHKRKDGTVLWVVPRAGPIEVLGEKLIVSLIKDVSQALEAQAAARTATEASLRDRQLVLNAVLALLREPDVEPALATLARVFAAAIGGPTCVWLPASEGGRTLKMAASSGVPEPRRTALASVVLNLEEEAGARKAWESGVAQLVTPETARPGSFELDAAQRLGRTVVTAPLMGRGTAYGILSCVAADTGDTPRLLALATTLGSFGGLVVEAVQLEARAKRDRQRAELLWHAASERLTDGIALLDKDLRIVHCNTALRELLRLDAADILGKPCREVFPVCASDGPCLHEIALKEQRRLVREIRGVVTGRPIRVEVIPAPLTNPDFAVIHVGHDLSEERAIHSQLVTADRLATIGRLAAGVAHEVNNPAAFVTVNLGVLRDRFVSGTARASDVLAILDESLDGMDRIREIVRDLKGFAREKSRDRVDLSLLVASALRMATHETRGRARVHRSLEPVFANVRGARIAQVILNLVVNAAQAIPAGDPASHRITVRTMRDGDKARIEIEDTGPGVPGPIAARIFDPFFTTKETAGGTGLGLWVSRDILEEEGGTIRFADAPGGGARFIVELAVSDDVDAGAAVTPTDGRSSRGAPGLLGKQP